MPIFASAGTELMLKSGFATLSSIVVMTMAGNGIVLQIWFGNHGPVLEDWTKINGLQKLDKDNMPLQSSTIPTI